MSSPLKTIAEWFPDGRTRRVVVAGAGEHGRVVCEAVVSAAPALELLGFLDPKPCEESARRLSCKRLGADADAASLPADTWLVVGVGTIGVSGLRRAVAQGLGAACALSFTPVVHRAAWVSPTAVLGEGAVIMAGAVVQSGARIGSHAVINSGAVIEHDVIVGDFAQVGPRAVIGGGARVLEDAYVGIGATVRDHVIVGRGALVGMGAVVVGEVAPGITVKGVPAR